MRNPAKFGRPVRTGRPNLAQQNLDFLDDPLLLPSRAPPRYPTDRSYSVVLQTVHYTLSALARMRATGGLAADDKVCVTRKQAVAIGYSTLSLIMLLLQPFW